MEDAHFTVGLRAAMSAFATSDQSDGRVEPVRGNPQDDVCDVRKIQRGTRTEPFEPQPYSALKYLREVDRLERVQRALQHVVEHGEQHQVLRPKFFETVTTRSGTCTEVANRDADNWVRP
jgi:hypothetical protein